jgi:hypothetical protein
LKYQEGLCLKTQLNFISRYLTGWTEYAKDPLPETTFDFKLEYFNTASSKLILDVLTALEDIENAKVAWYFYEDDEDMEEAGEEFSELVDVDFELKSY